jgi:RNA polymerase sigma-70 factor (ECF subfamily)
MPRTWLLAILRRKIADLYRRDPAAFPRIEADLNASRDRPASRFFDAEGHWLDPPSTWKSPPESLEGDEFWIVFNDCAARLPRHLAQAFTLREIEGIDVDRLRTVLGIGAANLRVRLHRARLLLRACLEKNWFDAGTDRSPRLP